MNLHLQVDRNLICWEVVHFRLDLQTNLRLIRFPFTQHPNVDGWGCATYGRCGWTCINSCVRVTVEMVVDQRFDRGWGKCCGFMGFFIHLWKVSFKLGFKPLHAGNLVVPVLSIVMTEFSIQRVKYTCTYARDPHLGSTLVAFIIGSRDWQL